MGKASFLFVLGAGVVAEVALLLAIGDDLTAIAIALLGIQAVCAVTILTLAFRQRTPAGQAYAQV
jgi:voltage-gated potassium channel Kch